MFLTTRICICGVGRWGGGGRGGDKGRPPGVRGELLLSRTMWAHWAMVGTRHNDACPRKLVMVRVFRTKLHGQHHGMLWNISVESVESVESTGVYCPVETCSQTDSKWLPRHLTTGECPDYTQHHTLKPGSTYFWPHKYNIY